MINKLRCLVERTLFIFRIREFIKTCDKLRADSTLAAQTDQSQPNTGV